MSSKYDPRNISMPSTGNPELDQREIQDHIRSSMRIDEGLCPSHSDASVVLVEIEPNSWECPRCGFVLYKRVLHVGGNSI